MYRKEVFAFFFKNIILASIIISLLFVIPGCTRQDLNGVNTNGNDITNNHENEKEEEVTVDIKEDIILIKSKRLKVEISKPGKDYTSSRFDWGGIVKQVTLDDKHTFLSTENPKFEYRPSLGFGIIGQFEPAFPRHNEGEYQVASKDNSIIFTKEVPSDEKERGFKLIKTISVEGNKLSVKSSLTNLGEKPINMGEYNHNFMIIDQRLVGPDYELEFGFDPVVKSSPITGKDLFSINERVLTWNQELSKSSEFLCQLTGYEEGNYEYLWKLTYKPLGAVVKASGDFDITKVQLWGRAHTICPEFFLNQKIEAGESFEWTRNYEFDIAG